MFELFLLVIFLGGGVLAVKVPEFGTLCVSLYDGLVNVINSVFEKFKEATGNSAAEEETDRVANPMDRIEAVVNGRIERARARP
jgi:hypothetical protein